VKPWRVLEQQTSAHAKVPSPLRQVELSVRGMMYAARIEKKVIAIDVVCVTVS
jgi:hypothetical protein